MNAAGRPAFGFPRSGFRFSSSRRLRHRRPAGQVAGDGGRRRAALGLAVVPNGGEPHLRPRRQQLRELHRQRRLARVALEGPRVLLGRGDVADKAEDGRADGRGGLAAAVGVARIEQTDGHAVAHGLLHLDQRRVRRPRHGRRTRVADDDAQGDALCVGDVRLPVDNADEAAGGEAEGVAVGVLLRHGHRRLGAGLHRLRVAGAERRQQGVEVGGLLVAEPVTGRVGGDEVAEVGAPVEELGVGAGNGVALGNVRLLREVKRLIPPRRVSRGERPPPAPAPGGQPWFRPGGDLT